MAESRHNTYYLFINFKAAYDSIARVKLYDAMSSFGIPAKLIRLVRMAMTNVTCQVRVDGKLSGPFATTKGLRRGDGLARLLFNLALQRAIRDSRVETTGTIFYKSTQILAYADDIDIIGSRSLPRDRAGGREPRFADKRGKNTILFNHAGQKIEFQLKI